MPVTAQSIAGFAAVLADRSRASMCLALLDGRAWTAGELARHAGVARSTASEHLSVLVAAGVLTEERQGRHRYVRLAGPEVAAVIEDLGAVVGEPVRPTSLRAARAGSRLAEARTCYDHLAGTWGVAVFDALVDMGLVGTADGLVLTPAGRSWFAEIGAAPSPAGSDRRPTLRACLDWTERRSHLGGSLGAALLRRAVDAGWLAPVPELPRALTVTVQGRRALTDLLGIDLPATSDRTAAV